MQLKREEIIKQKNLDRRFASFAILFWLELSKHGIIFLLPFDREGGKISEDIRYAAKIDRPVLVHGPTGTGKELAAKAIHLLSDRKKESFKSINCANLSGELLESELFGHKKGAFTGAHKNRKGILAEMQGGYIHLDEIGETTQAFQAKLLRLFESNVFYALGDSAELKSSVRFILTTNRPLERLRGDIFHRIEQKIYLPALIHYESKHTFIAFLLQILGYNYLKGTTDENPGYRISLGALAETFNYDWPGNIRELKLRLESTLGHIQSDMDSSQEEFAEQMEIKYQKGKVIYTFGLCDRAKVLTHFPKDIYNVTTEFMNLMDGNAVNALLRVQNRNLSAKLDGRSQLADIYSESQKQGTSLIEMLLGKPAITGEALKNLIGAFSHIAKTKKPLDDLEAMFLKYFIGEFAGKLSMHGAAKKLGLSGGEKFRRLLKKHGLQYITKTEMLDALRFIK